MASKNPEKEAKLAKNLKENLKRRKAQSRIRQEEEKNQTPDNNLQNDEGKNK